MPNISPQIIPAPGFKCSDAATYFTQMQDQTDRLMKAIDDITPDELEWQPAPKMNTIGMLLAHMAGAEVAWAMRGLEGYQASDLDDFGKRLEGLGFPDDGLGFDAGDTPPTYFAGKNLAYFRERLDRAREYWRNAASKITCDQMKNEVTETIWNGTERVYTPRWVMYHILVHFPGHAAQIYMLRHMYQDRK